MISQNHNIAMFEACKALQAKKIRVYSIKCDVFTVHQDDLDLVIGHRTSVVGRGDRWKVEEKKHTYFPVDKYQYQFSKFSEISKLLKG